MCIIHRDIDYKCMYAFEKASLSIAKRYDSGRSWDRDSSLTNRPEAVNFFYPRLTLPSTITTTTTTTTIFSSLIFCYFTLTHHLAIVRVRTVFSSELDSWLSSLPRVDSCKIHPALRVERQTSEGGQKGHWWWFKFR